MESFLKPEQLKKISEDIEMAKAREALEKKRKADESLEELRTVFMAREVSPEAPARINAAIKRAAQAGLREIQVVRFSSDYCNDGGRMINSFDPDWPKSLEGFAKRAYEYFEKELRPLGFKLRAEIANFPDGIPGDVAMFLRW
jgi:hypothetical protein